MVVFERGDQVGGLWVYTPNVESDPIGLEPTRTTVHSNVYHSLRTNLPRDSMGFSDYPFVAKDDPDRDPRLFPGHREVMMYLQDFAREFGIDELVRFETEVVRVRFVEEEEKWKIKSKQRHKELDEIFDAVAIAPSRDRDLEFFLGLEFFLWLVFSGIWIFFFFLGLVWFE